MRKRRLCCTIRAKRNVHLINQPTMTTDLLNMKGLPFVPVDPLWLSESPAYHSDNPAVVRAVFALLAHAWTAVPAGTVPSSLRTIAGITGLSEQDLHQHYEDLFEGWVLKDGRMVFTAMHELCIRIADRYKDTLCDLQAQSAATVQAPEEFTLTPPEVGSKVKGKHLLPKNWQPSPELREWYAANGYSHPEDLAFIVEKFINHHRAHGERLLNWDAAARSFAMRENKNFLPSRQGHAPSLVQGGLTRSARFGTAGQSAVIHNSNVLAAAASRAKQREGVRHG